MRLYYNPLDLACKSIVGAVEQKSRLDLRVFEYPDGDDFFAGEMQLVFFRDGEGPVRFPMQKKENCFSISLKIPKTGLYFYYFTVPGRIFSRGRLQEGTFSGAPAPWQLTVYRKGFRTPDWLKGGVLYQIFPDRFRRFGELPSEGENGKRRMRRWGDLPDFRPNERGEVLNNDFFGGNLKGIEEKLDYLSSLGVTAIYLNPIFEAFSNHRYDTGDFFKIDELLGTVGDFRSLVESAGRRGIRLILDGVFNHVGADSVYFNRFGNYPTLGAFQSPDSPYFSWFSFREFPEKYDCWWGIETLPAIRENDRSYREFLFGENGVLRHWLRFGIGGFRLDVVDELPDGFLRELRQCVKNESPDAAILGEVWEDASDKISYGVRRQYLQGEELDGTMNYPLKDAILDFAVTGNCERLRETLFSLLDHYPKEALDLAMNVLSTHDTPRILSLLGRKTFDAAKKEEAASVRLSGVERQRAEEKLKMAALLQFTLPGVPCVYYGDENGMEGGPDPLCRGCFDWEHLRENLIGYYRKLGKIRAEHREIFAKGTYREIFAAGGILVFERALAGNSLYVYVNNSAQKFTISLDRPLFEEFAEIRLEGTLSVEGYSYGLLSEIVPQPSEN